MTDATLRDATASADWANTDGRANFWILTPHRLDLLVKITTDEYQICPIDREITAVRKSVV